MIYLDYSATTPVDKKVLNTFEKVCLEYPGNSNSLHSLGMKSKELEDYSTEMINKLLRLKDKEIIYTSGSSEANNMAIKGVCNKYSNRGKHIITTYLEHSSVIEPIKYLANKGFEVDYVKINDDGLIDIDNLKELLRDDTVLVSISYVDSELGIKQQIEEIGELLKEYPKCYFHVDCTQALGKIEIDFSNIDLASVSAHKIYGLKGVGLLIKNKNLVIEPLIHGGKSTTNYRSGTPALPLIVSMMRAIDLIVPKVKDNYEYVSRLNKKLINKLKEYDKICINSTNNSVPHIINFSIKGIKSETFLHALENYEVYISTKSACSSGGISDSVYAVSKDRERASNSLRISLSYLTTEIEIEKFLEVFDLCYRSLSLK